MLQRLKSFMLPLAMLTGFLFSDFFAGLAPITPWLIFVMLFVTFCRITPRQMHFSPMHWWLLLIQIAGGLAIYLLARFWDETAAQAMLICILAPTATSAVVIAGMLGANLAGMATFTFLSNLVVAAVAPVIFSFVGTHAELPFFESFLLILKKVLPMLVLPFLAAFLLLKAAPKLHSAIGKYQVVSFYLWSFALMIVTGITVRFIRESDSGNYTFELVLALITFAICVLQFFFGRRIGRKYGDRVAGGQSLGQKNTILAIWMAQAYLNPVASIAPASYVIWQNVVNSWQLWRDRNRTGKTGQVPAGGEASKE